ncbi:SDR family NAD(P)-dependent oxidoreductase [Amorphus sp. 3PC139-8]|uniref:SDR family NAD(P)-dependent oxidoreductase n=1 Tax=Amorphus sp. 3PC139-8 TaxID=2735676 RepID=UPI00345E0687
MNASPKRGAVIVTGAGQGLGQAFAVRLAAEHYPVVVADIASDKADAVAKAIAAQGHEAAAIGVDVTDEGSAGRMVELALDRFGAIEGLVNNASIFSTLKMRPFFEIPLDEWRSVVDVNMTGVFICSKAAAGPMREREQGRIINIASSVVPMGRQDYLHYVGSKGGVVGMTRAMARELGPWNITVNAVLPGATETGIERATVTSAQREALIAMRSLKRAQVPDDLAGVVSFLMSEDSRFMTGQNLIVDGGAVFN